MKLVLLPGLDGTGILFQPLIEALPQGIDVQIISYSPNELQTYSELVEFVMNMLPTKKYVLVGESFSGPIAYQIALRKPKNLHSVVFVSTFLENPRGMLLNLCNFLPINTILSGRVPNIVAKTIVGFTTRKEIIELFKKAITLVHPEVILYRLQQIEELKKQEANCKVKSTYIQPKNDWLVPKRCVINFKTLCRKLEVFQVEGSDFVLQTNPVACARIIANETAL